jgi:hypothetical protein
MSLSRIAQRISLPALLAVVLAAVLLAIAPGRATPDVKDVSRTGADRGSRGTDRGDLVRFRLRDGSTGEVYFESRFDHPDRGETIEVYRSGDGWGSPQERSTYGLAGGIGALALSGLLALGWFRVRRRGSLSPASR